LFEGGIISATQGCEMVGISKRAFIEILDKYGVSLLSQPINDLDNDIKNA